MTDRTMRRLALFLCALSALAPRAHRAHAQTTPAAASSDNMTIKYGGEEYSRPTVMYVNKEQCAGSIEFSLTGYITSSSISRLEVWVSTGADCFTPTARAISATNTQATCWQAAAMSGVSGTVEFPISAAKLFDRDGVACDEATNTEYKVQFVPLGSATESSPMDPPKALTGVQQLYATFTLYTERPAAPSNARRGPGENALTLSWDAVASGDVRSRYRVYFDYGDLDASTREQCGSGAFDRFTDGGREPPPPDTPNVYAKTVEGTSASLSGLDEKGIRVGNSVRAAVTNVDVADNPGYLTDPVCIQRIETISFIDACNADPECAGQLESCSFSPSRRGGALGLSLVALALVTLIRRRRSA